MLRCHLEYAMAICSRYRSAEQKSYIHHVHYAAVLCRSLSNCRVLQADNNSRFHCNHRMTSGCKFKFICSSVIVRLGIHLLLNKLDFTPPFLRASHKKKEKNKNQVVLCSPATMEVYCLVVTKGWLT